MRWLAAFTIAFLLAGCAGSAATPLAPTSSFSPADMKTLTMICTWNMSVKATSDGLKPLIAEFPSVSDHATFRAKLDTLRSASATLTNDPASGDAWMVALERRFPRDELMELAKALENDSGSLLALFNDLDAWATKDNLDPTSDLAAQLQQEIAAQQPLLSDQLGATLCR